jgi:DNA-binding beta-propeller fold protein YncE
MCGAGESAARGVVGYLAGRPAGHGFPESHFPADYFNGGFEVASPDGATVYFGRRPDRVEKVDIASGTISTLARYLHGSNEFAAPRVLAVTSDGAALFVTNWLNRIWRIDTSTGQVEDFARIDFNQGEQPGGNAYIDGHALSGTTRANIPVWAMALMPDGSTALLVDTMNHVIRTIDMGSREVRMFTGFEIGQSRSFQGGYQDGPASSARFNRPTFIRVSADGSKVFVVDGTGGAVPGGCRIRVIDMTTRFVSTLAGPRTNSAIGYADGFGENARFAGEIRGIALSPDGIMLIVADSTSADQNRDRLGSWSSSRLRTVNTITGEVRTLAGSGKAGMVDGAGTLARFSPLMQGVAVTPDGRTVIVGDAGNGILRTVSLAGGPCVCNAGLTRNGAGVCEQCAAGKFKAGPGDDACTDCEEGKFSAAVGATVASTCADCGAGKYTTASGATAESTCLALSAILPLRLPQDFLALIPGSPPKLASPSTRNAAAAGSAVLPAYIATGGPLGNGHVSFDRTQAQYLDGGARTFKRASNGGFTVVAVVRFRGSPVGWERIIDFGILGGSNNIVVSRYEAQRALRLEFFESGKGLCGISLSHTVFIPDFIGDSIEAVLQDQWMTLVFRYRAQRSVNTYGNIWHMQKQRCTLEINGQLQGDTSSPMIQGLTPGRVFYEVNDPDLVVTDKTLSKTYVGRNQQIQPADGYLNGDIAGLYVKDEYVSDANCSLIVKGMDAGLDFTSLV